MAGTRRDPREDRLPKWTQAELVNLRQDLARVTRERDALASSKLGPEDSPVRLEPYDREPVRLDPFANIAFRTGPAHYQEIHVRLEPRNGALVVTGMGGVSVHPKASNHFEIRGTE